MRTLHRKDDAKALRLAGWMGHEYVAIAGTRERREVVTETNSAESAKANLAAYHTDPVIYRKAGSAWELVEIIDRTVNLR